MSSLEKRSVAQLFGDISAKSPTPGGGAVAAMTGTLAASLGAMVLQYSIGKKSLAEHAHANETALQSLNRLAREVMELADADMEAYGRLNTLWKLNKDDPKRIAQWDAAVDAAIDAPKQIVQLALQILQVLEDVLATSNRLLVSDLAIAAILADAAARAGAWNVSINFPQVSDSAKADAIRIEVDGLLRASATLAARVEQTARAQAKS